MTNPVKAVAQADFDTWMNDKLAKKKAELEKSKTASTATVTSPEAR